MSKPLRIFLALALLVTAFFVVRQRVRYPAGARVEALASTDPVPHMGDAADDPAIWLNRDQPESSFVLGTDKKGGLAVYNLDGKQLHYVADSPINNVDLRDDFSFNGESIVLVAGSDNRHDQILFYELDRKTGGLTIIPGAPPATEIDAEGITLYHSPVDGRYHAFVVGDSEVDQLYWAIQWTLSENDGALHAEKVRSLQIGTKAEGCVADDVEGTLYVSEEDVGIWRYNAEPNGGSERTLVCDVGYTASLRHDVEGLSIFETSIGRLLLASSQGSDDYVLLRLGETLEYLGRFGVPGIGDTDGLAADGGNFGPRFPRGLIAIHDGRNDPQSYRFVSWQDVEAALEITE